MNPYKPILQVFQDAGLNDNVRRRKRKSEQIYADILVASCDRDDWWYTELIGMTFFCRITFWKWRRPDGIYVDVMSEAYPTRLTNTISEESLMSFHPIDIIIL